MTSTPDPSAGALQSQLDEQRQNSIAKIPPDVLVVMKKAAGELAASGISEGFLQEGQKAPGFTLLNLRGEEVSLSGLLEKGPVVLAFYRGAW